MPTNIVLKNLSQLHTLKVRPQNFVQEDSKNDKKVPGPGKWKDVPVDGYIKPGESLDLWLGDSRRFIVEELPT